MLHLQFESAKNKFLPLQMLALATCVVFTSFMWQGNKGFSLWDEGFLWYGAQRVMLGEVPIRDFMAYDPGRYWWSAAFMSLCSNNGIMTLRGAVAIFQAAGLFVGLLLIARSVKKQNFPYLLLSAIILVVWMFPRHKLFDISLSIFLIGLLAFLVQNPTRRRYFFAGLCVGLVAIFGRNHGMYGVAGSIGVMSWLNIKRVEGPGLIEGFSLWSAGVIAGFMPIFFMALLVPGFAVAFWESIRFLFEVKTTNLPLPIPWPWRVNFASVPLDEAIRGVLVGLLFIDTVVFGVLTILWVVWQKFQNKQVLPALVATSFLALPYAHYAYSRADIAHLAQGIFPLLVGCLVLLAMQPAKIKWPLALMLCTASLWVSHIFHPGWQCHINKRCVNVEISGSNLQVDPGTSRDIGLLRKLAEQYAPDGQSFVAWPGAYALLERKSPIWEIYVLFPRSQAFEKAEIERIKTARPGFVLVDLPLDGHDELRFQNTHPLIHQYILDNFEPLPISSNPAYQIYKAKGGA
ncbi:MAG: hypothetical protein NTY00_13055 [Deltaproteobacteria bacterium]|nr:hypothetical protein [Deltaproteobacteria bacterium]